MSRPSARRRLPSDRKFCAQRHGDPDSRGIQFQNENHQKGAPDPDYWPKSGARLSATNGKDFPAQSRLQAKCRFSLPSAITILFALNTYFRMFKLIPNAGLQSNFLCEDQKGLAQVEHKVFVWYRHFREKRGTGCRSACFIWT